MSQKNIDLNKFFEVLDESLTEVGEISHEGRAGLVTYAQDGIVRIEGAPRLRVGEVIKIEGAEGIVMQIERDVIWAAMVRGTDRIRAGLTAEPGGTMLGIPVSEGILGRVVDPLGNPLDGGKKIEADTRMPLEQKAPDVMAREPVTKPLRTGILAIDALVPIGRGQRELIIGDRQTGKSTVAIDTILNQASEGVKCVYVAVGQREANVARVVQKFKETGALKYTTVVHAPGSDSAVLQYLAPYAGAAIAEYFMHKGEDTLVVYDDLSKHAVAYREMSLLLRRPPGREAYPGDVFYLHSRLLERAANLDEKHGGGSMTALPIIETQAGDVSAYIPTNVISITDGQIFLDTPLFYRGVRPAIHVGISVSRVGGNAQTKIMKKASGGAKLGLAQYYELAAFSQFASELDAESKRKLVRGERLVEALKQRLHAPYSQTQEVLTLWVVSQGFLDKVPAGEVVSVLESMRTHMNTVHKDLMQEMDKASELSEDTEKELRRAVEGFFSTVKEEEQKTS